MHGSGKYKYTDGSVYVGSFHSGERVKGVVTYPSGTTLQGEYVDDTLYTGEGYLYNSEGSVFCGKIEDYQYKQGRLEFSDEMFSEGTFVNGTIYNGYGVLQDSMGVYFGEVVSGMKHGSGSMVYADGSVFNGEFAVGLRCGSGNIVHSDGSGYEGTWSKDVQGTVGRHAIVSKEKGSVVFEGVCSEGVYSGHGRLTTTTDGVYEGMFRDSQPYGVCTHTDTLGRVTTGPYHDGIREGVHTILYPSTGLSIQVSYANGIIDPTTGTLITVDGAIYQGNANNGSCSITHPDGTQFIGEFKNNKIVSGSGTYQYNDGTTYTGMYENGVKSGFGKFSFKGTVVYEGEWVNDEPAKTKCINISAN